MKKKIVELAHFSLLKASEGGFTFNHAKFMLEDAGITPVRRESSPYVGHYGLSVPKKFDKKATQILFGR